MKTKFLTSLVVTVLELLLSASSGSAQEDRVKALVGKWEGTVQSIHGTAKATGNPDRTLIVESVEQKEGKWVATGSWGVTGN